MAWPDKSEPGVVSAIGISAMPDSVAVRWNATSKYRGATMVSPICTPIDSDADALPQRITGLFSTVSGRNGSAARVSRQPNNSDSTNEAAINISIGDDSHGSRVPPQV